MMRVIGIDDKGNVIIEKTSNVGKTEEMILMAETVSAIQEFGKAVTKAFQDIAQALAPAFQQLADIAELMEQAAEAQRERRIRGEIRAYQRKRCSRIRSRTRRQAKSTLKYKRYELRIYGRKERRGFHEQGRYGKDIEIL
ncbi:MAG: hypothetical protein NC331_13900 [Lachnospiraceae bacterium]|nr:hypothetical protein [Lachnospiraceae bacterium]MCM1240458.1 hypothetical protein [Lachnospiraceae bacterium]